MAKKAKGGKKSRQKNGNSTSPDIKGAAVAPFNFPPTLIARLTLRPGVRLRATTDRSSPVRPHADLTDHIPLLNLVDDVHAGDDAAETVYLASRCGCGECVMNHWLPPVSGQGSRAIRPLPARDMPLVSSSRIVYRVCLPHRRAVAVLHDEVRHDACTLSPLKNPLRARLMKFPTVSGRVEHRELDLNRPAIGVEIGLRRHLRVGHLGSLYTSRRRWSAPAESTRRDLRRPGSDPAA